VLKGRQQRYWTFAAQIAYQGGKGRTGSAGRQINDPQGGRDPRFDWTPRDRNNQVNTVPTCRETSAESKHDVLSSAVVHRRQK
jgi:hypothetical protein